MHSPRVKSFEKRSSIVAWYLVCDREDIIFGIWSVTENIIWYLVCNGEEFGTWSVKEVSIVCFYERNLIWFFVIVLLNMPAANIIILAHVMLIIYALIKKKYLSKI